MMFVKLFCMWSGREALGLADDPDTFVELKAKQITIRLVMVFIFSCQVQAIMIKEDHRGFKGQQKGLSAERAMNLINALVLK